MPPAKKMPAKTSVTLPGGYKVGEKVFYTWSSQTISNGDKLVHGQQGEVVGPATLEQAKGKGVKVRFPGNKGWIDCYLTMVRFSAASTAIPLPAPRSRDAAHVMRSRDSPCCGAPAALTARAAARAAAHCPGAGGDGGWLGAWCRLAASVAKPERAAVEPYLLVAGCCVRR